MLRGFIEKQLVPVTMKILRFHVPNLRDGYNWLEYADWWNPILAEPLQIQNGIAYTDDAIGTGINWNEEVISRYLN